MKGNLKTLIVLFKAHANVVKHVKQSLEDTDLSLNEFTAMEALYFLGTLSAQEIIDKVLIPNSSMTYVLENLAKKNYISRERDSKDRRVLKSRLTDEGRAVFETIYRHHHEHMRGVFDALTNEEEKQLQELLKKLGNDFFPTGNLQQELFPRLRTIV